MLSCLADKSYVGTARQAQGACTSCLHAGGHPAVISCLPSCSYLVEIEQLHHEVCIPKSLLGFLPAAWPLQHGHHPTESDVHQRRRFGVCLHIRHSGCAAEQCHMHKKLQLGAADIDSLCGVRHGCCGVAGEHTACCSVTLAAAHQDAIGRYGTAW